MRKKDILKFIKKEINKDREVKLEEKDIDQVIMLFKDCMIDCVKINEDFNYHNFIEVENFKCKASNLRNPKTGKALDIKEVNRVKISFTNGVKKLIRNINKNKFK